MALYNKMRPNFLRDVKGQENTIAILKDNLKSGNLPNAMLFVGTRGIGKTTIARITAKTVNCEHLDSEGECCDTCPSCLAIKNGTSLDVLELDAASNNGVDHIRKIIEQVQYKPIGKMRVIILDEVHMLSTSAFNALLKLLEEPPVNTLFILCTTEVHKIPATILSRVRKFTFETISEQVIMDKLSEINDLYKITAEKDALEMVARAAKGSMRDAESIYENFLDAEGGVVTGALVRSILGFSEDEMVFEVLNAILSGDASSAFCVVQRVNESGGRLVYLLEEIFRILMDIVVVQTSGDISLLTGNEDYLSKVSQIAFSTDINRLAEIADGLRSAYEKKGGNLELIFQTTILKLICKQSTISSLVDRISALESELSALRSGQFVPSVTADTTDIVSETIAENTIVEEIAEVEETIAEESTDDNGFTALSPEQLNELASLGVFVDTATVKEEVVAAKEEASVAEGVSEESNFDGFASFFDWT